MKPLKISIEGNIATGKSTFVNILEEISNENKWEITKEPVSLWTKKVNGSTSLLERYYTDPKRWSYTFESSTFMTRCNIERERQLAHSERSGLICSINERSILSGKYIFARNCFESGTMSHTEWDIYNEWTDYVFEHSPELKLDGIIYLRADPNVCASRMKSRGRLDESGVTLEYLLEIHKRHEEWLHNNEYSQLKIMKNTPILEINCNDEFKNDNRKKSEMLRAVKGFVASLQAAKNLQQSSGQTSPDLLQAEDIPLASITCDSNKMESDIMDDSGVFSRTNTPTN